MNRWQQIESICQAALELQESQRATFLEEACAGDKELRQEVESLLRFEKRGEQFIKEPALEVAAKMIAQERPESLLGRQLGSYQILSLLGAGGMGVVYKARDTRLKRFVALKVLPGDQVSDPERKRRFIQEARAASALNHPNIITIYDIGSEEGIDFVVMEYVAGKTLGQLIPRKGLRLDETLKLAIQMADVLAKAHSAGIIHRDLKPTNVMVTDEGLVKVLDFGLAKLTEVERDEEGTHTTQPQTETGTIIGTVFYMSPEQAEGKKVDARSDIFSFGAVLYEMVSGQKAFQGDSKMSTVAAILKQEPKPISQVVSGIPGELEKIIHRCLHKDRERRYQYIADLKITLQELRQESDSGALAGKSRAVLSSLRPWVWAAGAIAMVAIAIAGWFFRETARKPAAAPEVVPLTSYTGSEQFPSFSPDGNQVAFSWNGEKQDNYDIYVKLIGSPTPLRLTTDPADDVSPAFSPDGRSIGFVRVSRERDNFIVIPAIGGPERIFADLPQHVGKFSWFPDSKWVACKGLTLSSTETGETRSLTSLPTKSLADDLPAVSPDGRTVAFRRSTSFGSSDVYLLDLTEDLKPKGEPRRLTSLKGTISGLAWTPSGGIIFASGVPATVSMMNLWRVPASGAVEPAQLPFSAGEACWPTVSRNGRRLAYQRVTFDNNIWRLPLSGPGVAIGLPTKLITSTRQEGEAQYSPNGKQIAFASDRNGVIGIWVSDANGSNAVELFWRAGALTGAPRWSPDGQRLAFDSNAEGALDVYVVRASGGKPMRLTTDPADDDAPSWSRDGRWVYFTSKRTGRWETWKVSAEGGEAVPVTSNGGGPAFESPDGKFIYYMKGHLSGPLWKVSATGGEESQVLPSVAGRAFSFVNDGIYFIPEAGANGKSFIRFLNFATGKVITVAPLTGSADEGLSVSPDGRFLLFTQFDEVGSDLMLVENFQ